MRSTNLHGASLRTYPESDSLFFKFQGPTPASLLETAKIVKKIVERHGGTGFELARTEREARDLWADRKNALYSGLALQEGSRGWSTDVWRVFLWSWVLAAVRRVDGVYSVHSVPVSKLPDLVYETKQDLSELGLVSTIVGHVGDGAFSLFFFSPRVPPALTLRSTGNFHALLLFRNDDELAIAREAVHRMVERAIKMEGTCTSTFSLVFLFYSPCYHPLPPLPSRLLPFRPHPLFVPYI